MPVTVCMHTFQVYRSHRGRSKWVHKLQIRSMLSHAHVANLRMIKHNHSISGKHRAHISFPENGACFCARLHHHWLTGDAWAWFAVQLRAVDLCRIEQLTGCSDSESGSSQWTERLTQESDTAIWWLLAMTLACTWDASTGR